MTTLRLSLSAAALLSLSAGAAFAQAKPATPATPATPSMAPKAAPSPATPMMGSKAAEPAKAEAPHAHAPPTPPAELDQFKFAEGGSWKCKGQFLGAGMGPAHAIEATLKLKRDLNKFWVAASYVSKKTKVDPMPFSGNEFITYDGAAKKFVRIMVDNMGGWAQMTSTGFDAGKAVFTGEGTMGAHKMGLRHTITKVSDKEVTSAWDTSMDPKRATWTPFVQETCKR